MTPDDVARSYDAIASRWHHEFFPADNGIAAHRRAIAFVRRDVPSGGAALDVGCGGSGRIIELLLGEGFVPEGIDLSAQMLALARARHAAVPFTQCDVRTFRPPHDYALISAWDSLWHLPRADQLPAMRLLLSALAPGGALVFTMGGLDAPAEKRDEAMGVPMYYATPGVPMALAAIDACGCVCRHLEFDQFPEQHLVVIAQRPRG